MKKIIQLICLLIPIILLQLKVKAQGIKSGSIYTITSKASNKVLNVSNASMANGGNVDIWTDTKSDAERWLVTSVGIDQYTFTNVASGKMLHIANTNPANSVNVNQNNNTIDNTVKWTIPGPVNGFYTIQSSANTGFVLDVNSGGTTDGTNVQLWTGNSGDAQKWSFQLQTVQDAAPTAIIADQVFEAWKVKYNIVNDKGFWGTAEMMEIALDAYEVTAYAKYRDMYDQMYNNFITNHGSDWMSNDYNDDIAWITISCVRSYLLTGNATHLNKGKEQFDKMFARANTHQYGGDGLVWKQGQAGTNSCINGPAMVCCCYLAQATGDNSYYTKAIAIYNWSKLYLFNENTGKVNDNYNGTVGTWSSTYNQGTYLGASVMLYNYTKDPSYLTIANRIAAYTKNDMYQSGVMNNEEGGNDLPGFKGIFMRYARRYMVDCNRADYIPWLHLNAKVAYNDRNTQTIITTQWATRTSEANTCTAFSASTPVSLMINCPKSLILIKDAYRTIESENMDYLKGVVAEPCPEGTYNLGGIQNGYYSAYYNVEFGTKGSASAEFRLSSVASGGTIEIRLGGLTGTLIGTATVTGTGSWSTYATITCKVSNVKGLQNIYLIYKGTGYVANVNHFKFYEDQTTTVQEMGVRGNVKAYPTPTAAQLTVDFGDKEANQITIVDIQGRVLYQDKGNFAGAKTLDISNLNSGVYFLTIYLDGSMPVIKKIVKQYN
ncbi:MAG: carbohydrate-binding protein [Bacteroidetes bacterium]|nr:carbohydrate-binding protein [Bacteroidota bacterium]